MADTLPQIARYKPYYRELAKGKAYAWCACGLSGTQPFCDGSHKGTGIMPVTIRAKEDGEEVLFCGCKRTGTPPHCDGAHNNLPGCCATDDPDSEDNRRIVEVPVAGDGLALLDGGCYVTKLGRQDFTTHGTVRFCRIIGEDRGALYQSQFFGEVGQGTSPVFGFGDRHVILFTAKGDCLIDIAGRHFETRSESGVHVRPNEAFSITNRNRRPVHLFAAVCPRASEPAILDHMPATFDDAWPERRVAVDLARKEAMGDRFFQMLVDRSVGSDVVTQFIGEIPLSKAPPHRHLYEESLIILRGRGCMWTETRKAGVETGDVIFLPRKQFHSLQCTDPDGMLVVGVIYPGDNPTINY